MKSKLVKKPWLVVLCACVVIGAVYYLLVNASTKDKVESPIKRSFLVTMPPNRTPYSPSEIIVQFKVAASQTDRERVFRTLGSTTVKSIRPRPSSIAALSAVKQSIGSGDVNLVGISLERAGKVASTASLRSTLRDTLTQSRATVGEQKLGPQSGLNPSTDNPKDKQEQGSATFEDLLARVRSDPAVYYAQPNFKYHITTYPSNDSLYTKGTLWGVASSGNPSPIGPISNPYGTEAEMLWQGHRTGSRSVVIGIVDSGADAGHPDLTANIDSHDARDFYRVSGDANYNKDENGHGTHVAGIIGATGNNGFGVAGVAWNVTMIPVKFIGPDGSGNTADAVQAFNYLIDLRQRGMNVVAINASFYTSDADPLLLAAIKSAARAGIVTVSAAANSGQDIGKNKVYPASFDTSSDDADQSGALSYNSNITVAALDSNGQKASFSNYGGTVELGAPGVGIVSTMVPNPDASLISDKSAIVTESNGGTYASLDGTSMAAPYVTGAIVLLASAHLDSNGHTTLAAQDICTSVRNDAANTPTPSMSGTATTGGRLDIAKLIQQTTQ
jgi:subtilisin family serine protease